MTPIAEYAKIIGVSVQKIYKYLNDFENLNDITVKQNGILYLTDDGISELDKKRKNKQVRFNDYNDALIPFLREQCEYLREELKHEREHNRWQTQRLAELTDQIAELARNNQLLIAAEQNQRNIAFLDI
jgi:DNA-binding transcriptional MerR regulator